MKIRKIYTFNANSSSLFSYFSNDLGCCKCARLQTCFNRRVICRKPKNQPDAKTVCSVNTNMVKNASFTLIDVAICYAIHRNELYTGVLNSGYLLP